MKSNNAPGKARGIEEVVSDKVKNVGRLVVDSWIRNLSFCRLNEKRKKEKTKNGHLP